jgi:HAD superfamily hydrolase (TIGR01509 family)
MDRFLHKQAFLFDLDGTLVDSSALHERVFREVLADRAPHLLPGFDYESLKGKPTAESFRELGAAGELLDDLAREKQHRYRAALQAGELRVMPGAREILELLAGLRKRLFVVTGGSRRSVATALDSTGIATFFEAAVTSDDVVRGKPSPDSFLFCLNQFGISNDDALGIEDSINGLKACQAAGLDVVIVNNPELQQTWQPSFAGLADLRLALTGREESASG